MEVDHSFRYKSEGSYHIVSPFIPPLSQKNIRTESNKTYQLYIIIINIVFKCCQFTDTAYQFGNS